MVDIYFLFEALSTRQVVFFVYILAADSVVCPYFFSALCVSGVLCVFAKIKRFVSSVSQAAGLNSGETLEALQSCLDPSIRSIFEDIPTVEARRTSPVSATWKLCVICFLL